MAIFRGSVGRLNSEIKYRYSFRMNIVTPLKTLLTPFLLLFVLDGITATSLPAQEIVSLINGVQIQGESSSAAEIFVLGKGQVWMVNDDVRRYWFHSRLLRNRPAAIPSVAEEEFIIPQPKIQISSTGKPKGIYLLSAGDFDEFGHRICTITTGINPKPRFVFQGITKITPRYFVVSCLNERNAASLTWEMRMSTSTLPRETLSRLLRHQVKNREDLAGRLRIVSFYRQAEMYNAAMLELKAIIRDFPEQRELRKKEIQALAAALSKYQIRQIRSLLGVGQYQNAQKLIDGFKERQVDDETLVELADLESDTTKIAGERTAILKKLGEFVAILKKQDKLVGESATRVDQLLKTLDSDLDRISLPRLADFFRFFDDASQEADEKVSLAITGWLMGSGSGRQNFSTALSLLTVRDLVVEYLNSDNHVHRNEILRKLESMEGASVANIAKIVTNLTPYGALDETERIGPGCYRVKIPSLTAGKSYEYLVQLPPEYNPYRRYPVVVTLCGQGSNPKIQLDWWAGESLDPEKHRVGYAGYHGHIVIAPMWKSETQSHYKYNVHEHAAVLRSLLDVKKKFSVDTDRVFLSGHSMGADAAWDIALSHPDLWAGVIPIAGGNAKYIKFYSQNLRGAFPMYFVHGEHDYNLEEMNVSEWKSYMVSPKNDIIVCQFQGRVHEHFQEEIGNLFDWMKVQRRSVKKDSIDCRTYRPWDNFFWWVEVRNLDRKNTILPEEWVTEKPKTPDGGNRAAAVVKANITKTAATGDYVVNIQSPASNATVWLAPENFDLTKKLKMNGTTVKYQPSVNTLLEDVRTRRDRQHPFWARIDLYRQQSSWRQVESPQ